jgi:predicted ester cyclase
LSALDTDSWMHRWFAAGDSGEVAAFDDYLHSDVVVHAPLGFATRGIDAEKEVWRKALQGVPDIRHDIQEVISEGPTIAARVVVTGTHQGDFVGLSGTGKRFEIDQTTFAHIRDGKAFEIWEVADTASLLKQLGAPE